MSDALLEVIVFWLKACFCAGAPGDVEQFPWREAGAEPAGPLLPHQQLPEAQRVPDLRLYPVIGQIRANRRFSKDSSSIYTIYVEHVV